MTAHHPITPSPCSPCTHHHAIEGLDSCYCPDCKRSFAQGTAGYKEILERDSEKDRWNEEHFGEVPFIQEESGQVTLFWDTNEPPDPDDFPTLQEFESAWELWAITEQGGAATNHPEVTSGCVGGRSEKSNTSSNELLTVNPDTVNEFQVCFSERKNSGVTEETLVTARDLQPHTQTELEALNHQQSPVLEPHNTIAFIVGDRVTGSFGEGTILHIHGKKATVEYGGGLKTQIKVCHLQRPTPSVSGEQIVSKTLPATFGTSSDTVSNDSTSNELLEDIESQISSSKSDHELLEDIESQISSSKSDHELLEDIESQISSSKSRRQKGDGSGCIYWRTITKSGKDYHQAYYQYEAWSRGDRLIKSSKYIPKRLVAKIQELDCKKVPVRQILEVLGVQK